jgi:ribonucleotide reductase alpha subunit
MRESVADTGTDMGTVTGAAGEVDRDNEVLMHNMETLVNSEEISQFVEFLKDELLEMSERDYTDLYWESTKQTLVELYAKRDLLTGQPIEDLNEIIHRVAKAVAIAELKYVLPASEIINIELDDALAHPKVAYWAAVFADNIGNQRFWANTPANINADPAVSLMVLKYWAHGVLANLSDEEIWLKTDELRERFEADNTDDHSVHEISMGRIASQIRGKGCLAACGVAYVLDSLESIQRAAKMEAMAAKAAMGMGLNTSSLRPWSSVISNGAAASGPDRFYEMSIAKAVEAVAQGGRRGGALMEIRNSDHPDILFFIEKKKLLPEPKLSQVFKRLLAGNKQQPGQSEEDYRKQVWAKAEREFGKQYVQFLQRQNYLSNTNISVLAMPGFMEAVRNRRFYPATFNKQIWTQAVYDPRRPVIDDQTGLAKINRLTKEQLYEEYCVDIEEFPEAMEAARAVRGAEVMLLDKKARVRGHFYAPDVFKRIVQGMSTSGEPGIAFYDLINDTNANNHLYDLTTCNPCGEQFLPAGVAHDGTLFMGVCNLSSMHAAHRDFWKEDGTYNVQVMQAVARLQQRFMDNVTDVSWYPIAQQNLTSRRERRNGGGFAGLAEYLSRLELEFGQDEALKATADLYRHYIAASVQASGQLAEERGVYPLWEGSRFYQKGLRMRNSCVANNAPTGTLAQALQTSWGVDPHNGIVFSRKVRSRQVDFVAPGFREVMYKHNAWPESEDAQQALMQKIRENHKSCRGLSEIPEPVQKAFPVRVEVTPEAYVRHLAAVYEGASEYPEAFNSVSNTCSIPMDLDENAIADALMLTYNLGVKSITFYPDGSRLSQPVETIAAQLSAAKDDLLSTLGKPIRRNLAIEETTGLTYKVRVGTPYGGSTLHVTLNHQSSAPGELIEVYARMGKPGAIESGLFEAVGRLASAFLQYSAQFGEEERASAEEIIVKQLVNIQSGYPAFFTFSDSDKAAVIQSPCDGLAKAIQHYRRWFDAPGMPGHSQGQLGVSTVNAKQRQQSKEELRSVCDKCGSNEWLAIDGCYVCQGCGYSICG